MVEAIAKPLLCCPEARVTASICVSIYGLDAPDTLTLFRHADEVPATWALRAHEEFVGLDYADVTAIDFDPKADGVTRLRASCESENVTVR